MRRKSTGVISTSIGTTRTDSLELKNTGLRPSWDAFWAVEGEDTVSETVTRKSDMHRTTILGSMTSTMRSDGGIKLVKFVTGSEWIGEWDRLGMCGVGVLKMPHGVIYEGAMNAGVFEGIGQLKYPNGGTLEGFWHGGKLKYCQYDYADGLKRDSTTMWTYCKKPDRRFLSELEQGLRPADTEQLSLEDPPREIPPGHLDVGDGFYNPSTKCVTDPVTGEILRIPTAVQERWKVEFCRAAEIGTVGYRPDLYENWFRKGPSEGDYSEVDREMLSVIQQDGYDLDSVTTRDSRARSTSLQSKLDTFSLRELRSVSSVCGRSAMDMEEFLRKIIKELESSAQQDSGKPAEEDGKTQSDFTMRDEDSMDELDMIKLLHDIAVSFSGKGEKHGSHRAFSEQWLTPEHSEDVASIATQPFALSLSPSSVSKLSLARKISSHLNKVASKRSLMGSASEFLGSTVHYSVDYSEYEPSEKSNNKTE